MYQLSRDLFVVECLVLGEHSMKAVMVVLRAAATVM